jgi:hypothetical protein
MYSVVGFIILEAKAVFAVAVKPVDAIRVNVQKCLVIKPQASQSINRFTAFRRFAAGLPRFIQNGHVTTHITTLGGGGKSGGYAAVRLSRTTMAERTNTAVVQNMAVTMLHIST